MRPTRRVNMTQDVLVVAAGVLLRDRRFLMASRPRGKVYGGYWEFPGGKAEAGETPRTALIRELAEELGIEVVRADPWIVREHLYPHAHVRLHFFRVSAWCGEPHPHEGQRLAWLAPQDAPPEPMLPANGPVLRALSLPPIYAITQAESWGVDAFLARLDAALDQGLKLVQVRDKGLPEAARLSLSREVVRRAHARGARVLINGSVSMCQEAGADGLHLDSGHLMQLTARPAVDWLGASCHSLQELRKAEALGADFVMLSPVLPTASHPGEATLGWDTFAAWAQTSAVPVYALGGMRPELLDEAQRHGAHGIAMLRGAWS